MTGTTLSHYQIVSELGRGGMGIVYRAKDTKLDREVAIKVLPNTALASQQDRERFYREAKSAAALNHPNIAQIYEIDEATPSEAPHGTEPSPFIAMEYVAGGTLEDLIRQGPLKIPEALRLATQIAEALQAAHAKEIVHRDIKSSNVMLTAAGDAKVLDFGLALTAASTKLTRMGSTLGTVATMSPEQARGELVDHRSDLWALGVVLYEMVAGTLPFPGDYEQAVVYSILNADPEPLTALRTGVPMPLEMMVDKLLAKSAAHRYQSAADLVVDLKRLSAQIEKAGPSGMSTRSMAAMAPSTSTRKRPTWMLPAAILAGCIVVASAITLWAINPTPPTPLRQYEITLDNPGSRIQDLTASADGRRLAVAFGNGRIAVVDFETGQTTWMDMPGIQNVDWSATGEQLLLSGFGLLARAQADGSGLIPLRSVEGAAFARFGSHDDIYYGLMGDAIHVMRSDGTTDSLVTGGMAYPEALLDDGSMHIRVRGGSEGSGHLTWNARSGKLTRMEDATTWPLQSDLWVTRVASGESIVRKAGKPVDSGLPLGSGTLWMLSPNGTHFSHSTQQSNESFDVWIRRPDGTSTLLASDMVDDYFNVSPDGRRLVHSGTNTAGDLRTMVLDLESDVSSTIAADRLLNYPVWDPSGTWIFGYQRSNDGSPGHVVRTSANRSETPEQLVENFGVAYPIQWYPDGTHIGWPHFMTEGGTRTGFVRYDIDSDSLEWMTGPAGPQDTHSLSADGRFVSYVDLAAAAAGRTNFNVVELATKASWDLNFPEFETSGISISSFVVNWAPSGNEIDYIIGDSLMALPVDIRDGFRVTGRSRVVAVIDNLAYAKRYPDGSIYYSRRTTPEADIPDRLTIKVQVGWLQDLRRRLGAD